MSDQDKFRKLLEILMMLSRKLRYTIPQIAERFKISERTVYRYIETFKNAGLVISNNDGYIQIDKNCSELKTLNQLLHFSEEEAFILSKAIHSIDENNILKKNLVNKLYALYDFDRVAKTIIKKEQSKNIHNLFKAIKNKKQINLINYKSGKSGDIRTRTVEAFKFTMNYISVWCFEIESQKNKLFKTSRIEKVDIIDNYWQNEDKHKSADLDIFRISSNEKTPVRLYLSLKARNLLIEEYPLAEKYIDPTKNNKYLFDGWVCNFDGVGRFIAGLADEIEIIEPMALKDFIKEKIKKYCFDGN